MKSDDYADEMAEIAKRYKWTRLVEDQTFAVGPGVGVNLANRHPMGDRVLGFRVEPRGYIPDGEFYMIPSETLQHLDAVASWVSHEAALGVLRQLDDIRKENK